ncbi:MAG: hypothetical protein V1781_07885 [Bacteroidota bacterium]
MEAIFNLPVPTCLRADAQAEHGRQVAGTKIASGGFKQPSQ